MNPSEKTAEWIANAMKAAGISQAELARRTKISPSDICQILKGRQNISMNTLFRLVEACGLEITGLQAKKEKAA